MQEPKIAQLNDFSGGYTPDYGNLVELPAWRKLYNCYLDGEKHLIGRPHLKSAGFTDVTGIGVTHDKKLIVVSNATIYIDNTPVAAITGTQRLKFDYQIDRTIISTGNRPVLWDGTNGTEIARDNIFAIATMGGPYKTRLYAVDSTNKKRVWVSEALDPKDFAETFLADPNNIADDKKTSGGKFYGFSHDILDIIEFIFETNSGPQSRLVIATEKGFYTLTDALEGALEDMAYFPSLVLDITAEVYDAKLLKASKGIFYPSASGIYAYPTLDRVPMIGIERTIRKALINGQCHLSHDPLRRLLYLCPDNTNPLTYVFHLDWNIWTLWDIGIKDTVIIDNTLYIHTTEDELHTFEESKFDGLIPYDITIQSGLSGFGNPATRKRFKTVSVEIQSEEQLNYFIDIATQTIDLNTIAMNELLQATDRIDTYIGNQSERGSIIMVFTNYGEFKLANVFVNYVEKIPRLPLGISPL